MTVGWAPQVVGGVRTHALGQLTHILMRAGQPILTSFVLIMELSHSDTYNNHFGNSSAIASYIPFDVHRNAGFNSFINDKFVEEPASFMENIKMFKVSL